MSTTNMRSRIHSHHVNPEKNWFGVLFAIPVSEPLLCPAIEAELIAELNEAGTVDVIANVTGESTMLGSDDVHVEPAVEKIRDALQLLLGADIFAAADIAEPAKLDEPMTQEKLTPLTVAYKGNARDIRPRQQDDPPAATHRFVGLGLHAWGRFEGADPEKDKHFRVLEGSEWRWATPSQGRVRRQQQKLVPQKVLGDDNEPGTFVRDHIFESWSTAASIVAGRGTSGAWRWQRLGPPKG